MRDLADISLVSNADPPGIFWLSIFYSEVIECIVSIVTPPSSWVVLRIIRNSANKAYDAKLE